MFSVLEFTGVCPHVCEEHVHIHVDVFKIVTHNLFSHAFDHVVLMEIHYLFFYYCPAVLYTHVTYYIYLGDEHFQVT